MVLDGTTRVFGLVLGGAARVLGYETKVLDCTFRGLVTSTTLDTPFPNTGRPQPRA